MFSVRLWALLCPTNIGVLSIFTPPDPHAVQRAVLSRGRGVQTSFCRREIILLELANILHCLGLLKFTMTSCVAYAVVCAEECHMGGLF